MPLIILDRDGVINIDSDAYIKSPEEWQAIDGSIEAIANLCKAGFDIAIATNQSGLARGYFNLATLNAMHDKMVSLVENAGGAIAHIAFCPHGPDDGCDCRKPKIGLLEQIEKALNTNLENCFFVGDSFKDLQAGRTKNCIPVLVKTGKGEKTFSQINALDDWKNTLVFDDLFQASEYFIAQK